MKKTIIVLCLTFLAGCQNPYYTKLSEHKTKLWGWQNRFDQHNARTNSLNKDEASYIQTLTDEELVCYESAVQAFRSRSQTSQEIARRNLQVAMNEEKYQLAMKLLRERVKIVSNTAVLGNQIKTLESEAEYLGKWNERRQQAVSDYMLRESIRNSGR